METNAHIDNNDSGMGGTGKGYDESKRYTQTDKYKIKYLLRNTVWNIYTIYTQYIRYSAHYIFYSERVYRVAIRIAPVRSSIQRSIFF